MKPLTVISGFILGTCVSIVVSLAAVYLMHVLLGEEYPRFGAESGALTASLAIFTVMTAVSALSFYGMLTRHPARLVGQLAMWAGILLTAWYYWP